jgi:hypothetical protein
LGLDGCVEWDDTAGCRIMGGMARDADELTRFGFIGWPLFGLAVSVVCLVAVAMGGPAWGVLLIFGVFVAPSLVLLAISVRWHRQHRRMGEYLAQLRSVGRKHA